MFEIKNPTSVSSRFLLILNGMVLAPGYDYIESYKEQPGWKNGITVFGCPTIFYWKRDRLPSPGELIQVLDLKDPHCSSRWVFEWPEEEPSGV